MITDKRRDKHFQRPGEELVYGKAMSREECREYCACADLGPAEKVYWESVQWLLAYYRSWTHDQPLLVSYERDRELGRLSDILYRCCRFYADHYQEYTDRIPYDEKVMRLLEFASEYPFRAGTWRPDYLICSDGSLKVCEITSRFFGNGYFLSYFTEYAAKVFAEKNQADDRISYYEELLEYFNGMMSGKKELLVLMSSDKSDSIRLYVPYYRKLGLDVRMMHASVIPKDLVIGKDTAVVSAMNQTDILSLPEDLIRRLVDAGMRNDLRSVFLLHDKRLFALFTDPSFAGRFLDQEEQEFLKEHVVHTYLSGENEEVWEDARAHKENYILKHRALGKSESVYAGCLTAKEDWDRLFADGSVKEMILQPFCSQRIFESQWDDQILREYICGTILTVDDRYFGTGLFRTSSRPVINQADAHKAAPLVTNRPDLFPESNRL